MTKEDAHISCSVCGKQLTHIDENDNVTIDIHFDLERSRKDLTLDESIYKGKTEYEIVEDLDNRNVKMDRVFCESCFCKILSESQTLSKLFEVPNTAFKKDYRNALKNVKWVY